MSEYHRRYVLLSTILDNLETQEHANRFCLGEPSREDELGYRLDCALGSLPRDHKHRRELEGAQLQERDFPICRKLSAGQFGSVDVVRCALDQGLYVMKTITKQSAARNRHVTSPHIERHIHKLARNDAQSRAPRLVSAFQSDSALHLITTFADSGSLWDRMTQGTSDAQPLNETEVDWWVPQMVMAVEWIHQQGFVHRDIKPHNFVIDGKMTLLLTDFGSAAPIVNSQVPMSYCTVPIGTPDYIAPEILSLAERLLLAPSEMDGDFPTYGTEVDCWSLGATIYEMICGSAPFWAPTIAQTYDNIMAYRYPALQASRMASLVHQLLRPRSSRLCHQIRQSKSFSDVDWNAFERGTMKPPTDLATHHPANESAERELTVSDVSAEFTFEHFFHSFTAHTIPSSTVLEHPAEQWWGWTWVSDPASFASGSSRNVAARSATPARTTPARTSALATPGKDRGRLLSEREAFDEMLHCVVQSARKKDRTRPQDNGRCEELQLKLSRLDTERSRLRQRLQDLRTFIS